jgi:hypothetical protein
MAQLKDWFYDYNSYHSHSALGYLPPTLFREKDRQLKLPAVLKYRVKTTNNPTNRVPINPESLQSSGHRQGEKQWKIKQANNYE